MKNRTIAIVGRPNVGKSTIFNRIIGERYSIVYDTPGVTRDRIYARGTWLTQEFMVIDTGGLQLKDEPFQKEIRAQVDIAIEEASVIIFVVDGRQLITNDDMYIASLLLKQDKPVILAVNKIDDISLKDNIYDYYSLGLGEPYPISGIHGIGLGDILDKCLTYFDDEEIEYDEDVIKFSIVGEPNVGKSSIINALLRQDRVIVSDIEGTTRDSIDTPFTSNGKKYVAIDTAGIRRKGKVYENIEKYSVIRAMNAIDRSDVVIFVIDGEKGIREQDKHVAGYAYEAGKPLIILFNKWDLINKDDKTFNDYINKIRNEFVYLSFVPILFVSALTKQRINEIIPLVDKVYDYSQLRIETNILNEVILDAQLLTPASINNGKRLKIYYCTQVSVAPCTIILYVNNPSYMHFSYKRYIENKIREAFGFDGNPIRILARKK